MTPDELKIKIDLIYNEIISQIGSRGLREATKQDLFKKIFLEKFKKLEYPFDKEPEIEFTVNPTIGHNVNVNIVFLVKDENKNTLRL